MNRDINNKIRITQEKNNLLFLMILSYNNLYNLIRKTSLYVFKAFNPNLIRHYLRGGV